MAEFYTFFFLLPFILLSTKIKKQIKLRQMKKKKTENGTNFVVYEYANNIGLIYFFVCLEEKKRTHNDCSIGLKHFCNLKFGQPIYRIIKWMSFLFIDGYFRPHKRRNLTKKKNTSLENGDNGQMKKKKRYKKEI